MRFEQHGAPSHYSSRFISRRVGRGSGNSWPPRSPQFQTNRFIRQISVRALIDGRDI